MNNMLEKIEAYFKENSKEKILEEWSKYEEFDKIGPSVDDLIEHLETHFKIPKDDLERELKTLQILFKNPKFISGFLFRFEI
jgi:vacuolar-type H+-ATPase subunit I/STV1